MFVYMLQVEAAAVVTSGRQLLWRSGIGEIHSLSCRVPVASRKVVEFRKGIFQAWKVIENDCGHGKPWKSQGIPPIGHGIF